MTIVATAGHVDHGKSSLVLALTGTNPDRFEEERRRGLTIDLGFAHMTLPSGEGLSFIDVPGHVRFLRNMLAGVGGVDACMFVVAATEGWKPQSEEHLRILQLLGLRHGVIALTKTDLVDDEWRELQMMDIRDRLVDTFLADAPIVPVSTVTGDGTGRITEALDTLVRATPAAADVDRPRLWVDRVFAAKGSGTVVTGTLTGGSISADQRLTIAPQLREVRVRSIQSAGVTHDRLEPGHRTALNLSGIDHHGLGRGDAVVVIDQWRPTERFDASLHVLPSLEHNVSRRGAFVAYIGSGEYPVRLRVLGREVIGPGQTGLVRLHLATQLPLTAGDRFILRESGRNETVGGGEVLDVAPVLPASKAAPDRDVDRVIREHGWIDVDDLAAFTGERRAPTIGRWVADPVAVESMQADLGVRLADAGPLGLDLAGLDERERAVLATQPDVRIDAGRALPVEATDPLADHPFVAAVLAGGFAPPDAAGVDRDELRQLVRRGLVVERDGIWFHPAIIDAAATQAAKLLDAQPDGFTMSELRDSLGISRKYALPLANELDARGVTRRRGDVRIRGPRLPS